MEVPSIVNPTAQFALFVLAIACGEFIWKAWFEAWYPRNRLQTVAEHLKCYAGYRLIVFVSHMLMLAVLFQARFFEMFLVALILSLLGCTELLCAGASNWVFMRTQRTLRPLHLLYVALLTGGMMVLWTQYAWESGGIVNYLGGLPVGENIRGHLSSGHEFVYALVFFLASVPANYAVRWLVNKPYDPTFADTIMAGMFTELTAHGAPSEAAGDRLASVTAEAAADGPSLQGGRIIGVLERLIVIALFARGEITAVGFVFTAKSIVRYHDFAKPDFAEYYLIGTLYSVVIAVMLSLLL